MRDDRTVDSTDLYRSGRRAVNPVGGDDLAESGPRSPAGNTAPPRAAPHRSTVSRRNLTSHPLTGQ